MHSLIKLCALIPKMVTIKNQQGKIVRNTNATISFVFQVLWYFLNYKTMLALCRYFVMTCLHNTQNASKLFSSSVNWGYYCNFKFLFFYKKTLKCKKPLTSKKKLTKRKQANKKPKAAFFCAHKNFWGGQSRLFALCAFLCVWKFFLKKQQLEITLILPIYTTTDVITCFSCTVKNQKFKSIQAHSWTPPPLSLPHPFQCYLSLSFGACVCVCVFCILHHFYHYYLCFARRT